MRSSQAKQPGKAARQSGQAKPTRWVKQTSISGLAADKHPPSGGQADKQYTGEFIPICRNLGAG